MSKISIDPEVVIQELQAEIDFLRNRVLLQGQAIKDLMRERDAAAATPQKDGDNG